MMDELNTGPSLELGDCMNSWTEYSWLFGEEVTPPSLEIFDGRGLLELKNSPPFGEGSGGGLSV